MKFNMFAIHLTNLFIVYYKEYTFTNSLKVVMHSYYVLELCRYRRDLNSSKIGKWK